MVATAIWTGSYLVTLDRKIRDHEHVKPFGKPLSTTPELLILKGYLRLEADICNGNSNRFDIGLLQPNNFRAGEFDFPSSPLPFDDIELGTGAKRQLEETLVALSRTFSDGRLLGGDHTRLHKIQRVGSK